MDIFKKLSMKEVIDKQREQHSNSLKKGLTIKRKNIRAKDIHLLKRFFPDAKSVLCVGSREDSEVKDFINAGFNAVGTDILDETKLIKKIDAHSLDEHFDENSFDVVFTSHSLEHMLDVKKVLKNIKSIAKEGVFIVLPMTPGHEPKWKHPTVFEIMKISMSAETAAVFTKPNKYKSIWDDFDLLKPFELLEGNFRKGLTEPREVYLCLKF